MHFWVLFIVFRGIFAVVFKKIRKKDKFVLTTTIHLLLLRFSVRCSEKSLLGHHLTHISTNTSLYQIVVSQVIVGTLRYALLSFYLLPVCFHARCRHSWLSKLSTLPHFIQTTVDVFRAVHGLHCFSIKTVVFQVLFEILIFEKVHLKLIVFSRIYILFRKFADFFSRK